MNEVKQIGRLVQVIEESKHVRRLAWFISISTAIIGLIYVAARMTKQINSPPLNQRFQGNLDAL